MFDSAGVGVHAYVAADDVVGAVVGHDGTTLFLREEVGTNSRLIAWDLVTDTQIDLDNAPTDGTAGGSPADGDAGHQLVVTPF